MNKINKNKLFGLAALLSAYAAVMAPVKAFAAPWIMPSAVGSNNLMSTINLILSTIVGVVALIAVFMLVIAGIRYTTSGGDPASVKGAKDQMLYAIVGLVVAFVAFAIVQWVTSILA